MDVADGPGGGGTNRSFIKVAKLEAIDVAEYPDAEVSDDRLAKPVGTVDESVATEGFDDDDAKNDGGPEGHAIYIAYKYEVIDNLLNNAGPGNR